jgi:filamentous hemagglutinin
MDRKQDPSSDEISAERQRWIKVVVGVGVVLLLVWLNLWLADRPDQAGKDPGRATASSKAVSGEEGKTSAGKRSRPAADDKHPDSDAEDSSNTTDRDDGRNASLVVRNVRVKDESGEVVYRGDIDLEPTIDRIQRGERLRFRHDGIVFENREGRLPRKPSGYYHEFVQPTPGDSGPGGQRVVMGSNGEIYYTPDHYHTFRRIR